MSGKTLTVKAFSGVDMSNMISDRLDMAYEMENFRLDSEKHLRKRPGSVLIHESNMQIDGMWTGYIAGRYYFIVAKDAILYSMNQYTGETEAIGLIGHGKPVMFEFDRKLYILSENNYSYFDGVRVREVKGYTPLIATGCSPSGGGTPYESINMLSDKRRQQFSGDGTAEYHLAEKPIDFISYVEIDGVMTADYTYNSQTGILTFNAGSVPGVGVNNVEICYYVPSSDRAKVLSCKHAMLFGGNVDSRVFLWGNPDMPNYRFYSDVADGVPSAEYFPVSNYSAVGNSEITDIIAQYDRQLIFTKERAFYSVCELRSDQFGRYYTSFPVYDLNSAKGSLLKGCGCVVNNEPITLCDDGLNKWVSTLVDNEKNAVCFSHPIDPISQAAVRTAGEIDAWLFDFQPESELYFVYLNRIYVYNYRHDAWYVYTGLYPDMMVTSRGELFYSSGGNIYKLDKDMTSDNGEDIHAFWRSPLSCFGDNDRRKDIQSVSVSIDTHHRAKFGCGVYDSVRYVPEYAEAEANDSGIYSHTLRGRRKRIDYAGVCIESDDNFSDITVCSLSVTTKTKGDFNKVGIQ